jgi:L-ribulose-5-phosphate 3-epimerase UlaE
MLESFLSKISLKKNVGFGWIERSFMEDDENSV